MSFGHHVTTIYHHSYLASDRCRDEVSLKSVKWKCVNGCKRVQTTLATSVGKFCSPRILPLPTPVQCWLNTFHVTEVCVLLFSNIERGNWGTGSCFCRFLVMIWCFYAFSNTICPRLKVLGVVWNHGTDELRFKVRIDLVKASDITDQGRVTLTKLVILSKVARIYDTSGLASAFLIKPKLGIQHLWHLGISWDQELPSTI